MASCSQPGREILAFAGDAGNNCGSVKRFERQFRYLHTWLGMVVRHGFRHPTLELFNASSMAWVSRQEFRGLVFRDLFHPLPHMHRFVWIIAGICSKHQSDMVSFRLVRATVRQDDAILG